MGIPIRRHVFDERLHFKYIFVRDITKAEIQCRRFCHDAHVVNLHDIVNRHNAYEGTLVALGGDKPFRFKLSYCIPDRHAANPEFASQLILA